MWRVSNGKAERIAVKTGADRDGQTEVLSGVSSSDLLIAEPPATLAEGASVKVAEQ